MSRLISKLLLLLLPVAFFAVVRSAEKSFYDVLGVPKSASSSQIKSAYRRLSKLYHPDVSHEKDAKEKFQEVSEGRSSSPSLQRP